MILPFWDELKLYKVDTNIPGVCTEYVYSYQTPYSRVQNRGTVLSLIMCSVQSLSKMTSMEGHINPNPRSPTNHGSADGSQARARANARVRSRHYDMRRIYKDPQGPEMCSIARRSGPLKVPQNPSNVLIAGTLRVYILSFFFLLSLSPSQPSPIQDYTVRSTLYALRSTASKTTTMAQYTLRPLPYAYDVSPGQLIVYSIVN